MLTRVTETHDGDDIVISVHGDLDLASVAAVRIPLRSHALDSELTLVLDLTACLLLDSAGAGVIIGAARRRRQAGGRFLVVAPEGPARRFLAEARLDQVIDVVDRRSDADTRASVR